VLISVGKNNSYGHPAEETIARIEDSGAQILRTDECGNITVRRG
jgi:competence protein ComEC